MFIESFWEGERTIERNEEKKAGNWIYFTLIFFFEARAINRLTIGDKMRIQCVFRSFLNNKHTLFFSSSPLSPVDYSDSFGLEWNFLQCENETRKHLFISSEFRTVFGQLIVEGEKTKSYFLVFFFCYFTHFAQLWWQ